MLNLYSKRLIKNDESNCLLQPCCTYINFVIILTVQACLSDCCWCCDNCGSSSAPRGAPADTLDTHTTAIPSPLTETNIQNHNVRLKQHCHIRLYNKLNTCGVHYNNFPVGQLNCWLDYRAAHLYSVCCSRTFQWDGCFQIWMRSVL